jgi:aspartyl protease family protein
MGFMMMTRVQAMNPWLVLILASIVAWCVATSTAAAPAADERPPSRQVVLQGVLGNKALLSVDGKRLMLSPKDPPQQGIRVLRLGTDTVQVEIEGKVRQLRLGDSHVVTAPYKPRHSTSVSIPRGAGGMYSTVGSINGLPVAFLVDTGASIMAMNAGQAKRLGIDYRVVGEPTFVGTASGVSKAYRVTLDTVTVGEIKQHNISAVVIEGQHPLQVLLGMSFLGRLEIQHDGNLIRLKQKF